MISTVLVIDPTIGRADIPVLCERLTDRLTWYGREGAVVVCEVSGIAEPSAITVETLARLRLTARRLGADIRVRGAHARLRQLLAFVGLDGIVPIDGGIPIDGGSALEPHRQAEQREQPLDVEEVGDPADPAG